MGNVLLFEFGAEGGGAKVYKIDGGKVVEMGSSGGMLDEDEDPIQTWEKVYDNWDAWWRHFTASPHGVSWIYFYPVYMCEDVKPSIRKSLLEYVSEKGEISHFLENWQCRLDGEGM